MILKGPRWSQAVASDGQQLNVANMYAFFVTRVNALVQNARS